MCGIAGILSPDPSKVTSEKLRLMADALAHRGPDGEGIWTNAAPNTHIGFAHRRLSILDLSNAAAQPLHFRERLTIIHNGEVYNYEELRDELKCFGHAFQSTGDTEVMVAAYAQWGKDCVKRFDGMFAFAIWDDREQELFIARDRFGEKPLVYHYDVQADELTFASEEKALFTTGLPAATDHQVLLNYLGLGTPYIWGDTGRSFYKSVFQLPPASSLSWRPGKGRPVIERYWDLDKFSVSPIDEPTAIERFRELLTRSVHRRLRSDVPLGTSLSGGIDSNSIAALCRKAGGHYTHRSFSALFPGFEKDESRLINDSATTFGLNMHFAHPDVEALLNHIEVMIRHQGLPPSSASSFAQYEVFRTVAGSDVKVLLDGQGADETLGGYARYTHWFLQELLASRKFSDWSREKKALAEHGFAGQWGLGNWLATFMPGMVSQRLEQRAKTGIRQQPDLRREYVDAYFEADLIHKPLVLSLNDVLYADTMEGPLQELLHYADRNSMAFGREVRLPFLDHELVEFIFTLPSALKMHKGYPKWILRKSMERELPAAITWPHGKTGFEPPQQEWMSDPHVQQSIQQSKKVLADHGILGDAALKRPVRPHAAYDADGRDWRYWMAGMFLQGM